MKGVILAAGVSSRLRPLTDLVPKCLLELGGRSILGMTLANLVANGISDIVIVTGYREDQIRGFVRDTFPGLNVGFVRNDRFETTNNSYSLWLTERAVGGEGIVLLDSDIVFDRRIIGLLAGAGHDNCLAMKREKTLGDEEIKVQVGPGGAIQRIGKDVPTGAIDGHWGQILNQFAGVAIAWCISIIGTLALLFIVDKFVGLRLSPEQEAEGLDLSQHNEEGYDLNS